MRNNPTDRSLVARLSFYNECTGAFGSRWDRQVNMVLLAVLDGVTIGCIEYSFFHHEVHIQMMRVQEAYQRRGLATALWQELKRLNPRTKIHPGWATPAGHAFLKSIGERKNPDQIGSRQQMYGKAYLSSSAAPARRNPEPDFSFLRQYTMGDDGKPVFHAVMMVRLAAKNVRAIQDYLTWFFALPGLKVTQERERGIELQAEDSDGTAKTYPFRRYNFEIDADAGWNDLSDEEIAVIVESEYMTKIRIGEGKLTMLGTRDPQTGHNWRGTEYRIYNLMISSRSMRQLNDYIEQHFPEAVPSQQARYFRDPKKRRYVGTDFVLEKYLDGPAPQWVGNGYWDLLPREVNDSG